MLYNYCSKYSCCYYKYNIADVTAVVLYANRILLLLYKCCFKYCYSNVANVITVM